MPAAKSGSSRSSPRSPIFAPTRNGRITACIATGCSSPPAMEVPCEIFPPDTGLIVADAFGAQLVCEAPEHRLPAATRKIDDARLCPRRGAAPAGARRSERALRRHGVILSATATAGRRRRKPGQALQGDDRGRRHFLCAAPGSITGLLGGNGAGKTTTIAMIMGLVTPTSGTRDGARRRICRTNATACCSRMNFESPYVDMPMRLTVRQNLSVFAQLYGVADIAARIASLAADARPCRIPRPADRQALVRAKDPRLARQGAAQSSGGAAARRADRLA